MRAMKRQMALIAWLGSVSPVLYAGNIQGAWTGDVTVASQYISRGFQQSWRRPALQAGVEYVGPDGWYAGSWASMVSPYAIEDGHVEWDIYAGKRGTIETVGYRAGLYDYRYPGARVSASHTRYDYAEWVMGVDWHAWSLTYSLVVSRDYFGYNYQTLDIDTRSHSRGSGYLDITRSFALEHGFNFALHYGRERVNHFVDYSWQDASATLSRSLAAFDVALAYARAWNHAGVYRHVTTGVPDAHGRLHFSDPISGVWYLTIARSF